MKTFMFQLAVALMLFAGCRTAKPRYDGSGESIRNLVTYYWLAGNHAEACRWLDRAVEDRDYTACELLGWCYFLGDGVEQSNVQASRYFMRAAEIYWENWLLFIHYGERNLDRGRLSLLYKNIVYFEVLYEANVLKAIGLLNRSILLGNIAAVAKKDAIRLHLGDIIKESVLSKPLDLRTDRLDRIFEEFMMTNDSSGGIYNERFSKEELMAGYWGQLPGLRLAILPETNTAAVTNQNDIIALAESIADMPALTIGMYCLPKPVSFRFEGIIARRNYARYRQWIDNNAGNRDHNHFSGENSPPSSSAEYSESEWGKLDIEYSEIDATYLEKAYQGLSGSDYRAGAIVYIGKTLALCKPRMTVEEWQELFNMVVVKAKLTSEEIDLTKRLANSNIND